ncbi:LrgB family protein [Maledivibacter halophilus]|uniref:TIGR00659 family protein n=1 Tax=Maledivibacter halophilus TaxID=36842 RepID=A0A1T5M0F5_9FIRM|nr:LrgB family protein [Maledivibacter halophilus]SKC81706.1 TIGR00659 family protein [Maledivibacter halophilus]
MIDLLHTPLFGVIISIIALEIGLYINRKTKISLLNPLLISIVLIIVILIKFDISLEAYNEGGGLISFFLGPATVILAVPLYKQFEIFKANILPIIVGITVGCLTSVISVVFLSKLFGLSDDILRSLIPKSITNPIGIELSKQIGGIPSITVTAIIITGIFGSIIAPYVFKIFRIKDKVAIGVSLGTSSHALGTTKAIEMGETEGAMSGLSIGLAGLVTVILIPLLINLLC